ncbi:hypothetical protein ACF0H5_016121 [Mactra antiquata]
MNPFIYINSWIALVQPIVLCTVLAGLQHAGIFNAFIESGKHGLGETRDVNDKLNQLEEIVTVSENDLKELDERIATLTYVVDAIKADIDQITPGQSQQLVDVEKECSSQGIKVHVAIIGLTVLQLVTVVLVFVLWIKLSHLRANVPVTDKTAVETRCEKHENNNKDTEVTEPMEASM